MKAWKVSARHPIEGGTVVRFAETASKAKYAGLNGMREIGEADDYTELSARRFPEMDGREGDPPTMRELVEHHGWVTMCQSCDCRIDDEGAHDTEDKTVTDVHWDREGWGTCESCLTAVRSRREVASCS